jgi:hypothetical protein
VSRNPVYWYCSLVILCLPMPSLPGTGSFLMKEFDYMSGVSSTFPETITPNIQMSCLQAYQDAISNASRRLPCSICGGLSLYKMDAFRASSRRLGQLLTPARSKRALFAAPGLRRLKYLLCRLGTLLIGSSVRTIQMS